MKFFKKLRENLNKKNNYNNAVNIISEAELDVNKFLPEKNNEWQNNLDNLFDALNTVSLYKPKSVSEQNEKDEVLLSFFHEATLPSKVFGYEISLKIRKKIEKLIINSEDEQFKIWESLSKEERINNHGNIIVLFNSVFDEAKAKREEGLLSKEIGNKDIPHTVKTKNRL